MFENKKNKNIVLNLKNNKIELQALTMPTEFNGVTEFYANITPEDATLLLDNNFKNNRTIKFGVVNEYAKYMREQKWNAQDGGSIKISENGELVDGQHRLKAIEKADKTVEMKVAVGFTDDDIPLFDRHQSRTHGDVLKIMLDVKCSNYVASFEKLKIAFENIGLVEKIFNPQFLRTITPDQVLKAYDPYDSVCVNKGMTMYKSLGGGSKASYGFFYYIISNINKSIADKFWNNIKDYESKMSAVAARYIINTKSRRISLGHLQTFKMMTILWNAYIDGREVATLKVESQKLNIRLFSYDLFRYKKNNSDVME